MISLRELLHCFEKTVLVNKRTLLAGRCYSKSLKPVSVRNTRRGESNRDELSTEDLMNMKREFKRDVQNEFQISGDVGEPSMKVFDEGYKEFQNNYIKLDAKMRREKMFRKHYKDYVEKETSLLTWAEKEKIRFLHKTDPEQWTPIAISEAFPITEEGTEKLLKSTFRIKSPKEIHSHDEHVADKIRKIKSGEIAMNNELETKMKMRDQMPIRIGMMGVENGVEQSQLPKIIGEFESLVTPKNKQSTVTEIANVVPMNAFISISQEKPPDQGDSFMMVDNETTAAELKKLKIHPYKPISFSELQLKMNQSKSKLDPNNQFSNFKPKQEKQVKPTTLSDVGIFKNGPELVDAENCLNYLSVPKDKYKSSKQNNEEISSETRTYEYELKSQETIPETISIPPEMKIAGATYKQGNSYYDENGSFLYRVV